MDYSTIFDSDNDVILDFVYNDTSKQLEVKANLKRDTAGTNLLKIGGTFTSNPTTNTTYWVENEPV